MLSSGRLRMIQLKQLQIAVLALVQCGGNDYASSTYTTFCYFLPGYGQSYAHFHCAILLSVLSLRSFVCHLLSSLESLRHVGGSISGQGHVGVRGVEQEQCRKPELPGILALHPVVPTLTQQACLHVLVRVS